MDKVEFKFLMINKEHFGAGLKAIDLLILAQVEEFDRKGLSCHMTDEYFMFITGAGKSAVRASLDRLEKNNIIFRVTKVVFGQGKANRKRTIRLRYNYRDAISKFCA